MKLMKKSIKATIVVPLLVALVMGVTAMAAVVGILSSRTISNLTNTTVNTSVDRYAVEFKTLAQDAYGTVASLTPIIADILEPGSTREITDPRGYAVELLSKVLLANDQILGAWTAWEPGAFDGADAQFAGTSFYDDSGRFVPYVFRSGNGTKVEALADYDDPVAGDYYQGARTRGLPHMTDPYYYNVNGTQTLICSISVPIVEAGVSKGVVGVDLDLSGFIETMNASSILDDGYLVTLSPGGYTATHPNPDNIMLPFTDIAWMQGYRSQFDTLFTSGGTFEGTAYSDVLSADIHFKAEGVEIGNTGRHWVVIGVVPQATFTAASTQLLLVIILIGVALFLIVGVTAFLKTKNALDPLGQITSFMTKAGTTGDLEMRPEDTAMMQKLSQSQNEVGRLSNACGAFVTHITNISRHLHAVADGDLTADVTPLSDSDTLGLSLHKMAENLNGMFSDINNGSAQVAIGSNQVASAAQALAQGATQQAASTQQLSSSIAEVAEKTKANAERAEHSAALAAKIKNSAEKGNQQMDQMMAAVKEISEASQSIAKVIKTIDDIAFQTNILALNAAVEAARAGQHGKGFAVVADEVRNLAAKSAEAAKDTEQLIADSIEKAGLGEHIAGETATSLSEIVEGINESTELVAEIAQSSDEQSQAIVEINIGVDQVAQVVQQNSATAEESAAAAQQMSSQSQVLQQLISQFRLRGAQNSLPPPKAASAPRLRAGADGKGGKEDILF